MIHPRPSQMLVPDGADWDDFAATLASRREKVHTFLENWPGALAFRPTDIHDGLFSYLRRRGKGLRPLLVLLSCGAVGGEEKAAIPAAAAVEVFHTWTLVHDDIIDRDDTRRGEPTVHAHYTSHANEQHGLAEAEARHYGTAVAILTGDLQQSWCYALLTSLAGEGVAPELVLQLISRMASELTPELLEGEMLDVQYSLTAPELLSESDILDMLSKKTAALLRYAAWCGAMIGSGGSQPELAERLGRFAYLCGTAFQLQDDLLGLVSESSILGKPVGSDLREGKRTLLVHYALANSKEVESAHLLGTLGNPASSQDDVERALITIKGSGAPEYIAELANDFINQALLELDDLPDSRYRDLLRAWALFMMARQN